MKKRYFGLIAGAALLACLDTGAMSFSDNFEGYAAGGDLEAATTNWVTAPWSVSFDVIDASGDKKVQHDNRNKACMVAVNPNLFSLSIGQSFVLTNKFSAKDSGWERGVFFNYTKNSTTNYDLYTAYQTHETNGQLVVKIDKWVHSTSDGSGITNLMTAANLGAAALQAGNGEMVVTYDADTQSIGLTISIDSGFFFTTNIVDGTFTKGLAGLYGRAAKDYVVSEFSVQSVVPPAEPIIILSSFDDNFDAYAVGDLTAATTNWVTAPWDVRFDVIDASGDKKVQHDGDSSYSMVGVNSNLFYLSTGQNFAMTNKFSAINSGWERGVFFNYTKNSSTDYNLYTAYQTHDTNGLVVKIDKWVHSSGTGSVITNVMTAANLGSAALQAGNGEMVVTYNADTQSIGLTISIDSGFFFTTNIVDSTFTKGMIGLYGKAANGYVVKEFSVISYLKEAPSTVTLTSSAGLNGTVTPASTNVVSGSNATFVITANPYYRIASLTTNGTPVAGMTFDNGSKVTNFIWSNVQADGTLAATFTAQRASDPAGTPYEWLAGYGLTNYDADAVADQDMDGLKAWQEYIAGTDPTNKASCLRAVESPRNVISWSAVGGKVYSVYWSTNLVTGFTNLAAGVQPPYTNPAPSTRANFYQVRVQLP